MGSFQTETVQVWPIHMKYTSIAVSVINAMIGGVYSVPLERASDRLANYLCTYSYLILVCL